MRAHGNAAVDDCCRRRTVERPTSARATNDSRERSPYGGCASRSVGSVALRAGPRMLSGACGVIDLGRNDDAGAAGCVGSVRERGLAVPELAVAGLVRPVGGMMAAVARGTRPAFLASPPAGVLPIWRRPSRPSPNREWRTPGFRDNRTNKNTTPPNGTTPVGLGLKVNDARGVDVASGRVRPAARAIALSPVAARGLAGRGRDRGLDAACPGTGAHRGSRCSGE